MPFQDVYFTSAFLNQDDWNCILLQRETLVKYIGLQAMAILFHVFYLGLTTRNNSSVIGITVM